MRERTGALAALTLAIAFAPAPLTAQQITPYVDRVQPGFQLPPVPVEPLDKLYPPPALPPPPPSRATPAPTPYPGGTLGGGRRDYPQGFTMTIERPASGRAQPGGESRTIKEPRDIARQIARCWTPPEARTASEVTIRVSFTRAGALMSPPRVTYVSPGIGTDREAVRASILTAVERCAPFEFTDGLGSAISGRPLTLRFVAPVRGARI
jgi:hypothetical protein